MSFVRNSKVYFDQGYREIHRVSRKELLSVNAEFVYLVSYLRKYSKRSNGKTVFKNEPSVCFHVKNRERIMNEIIGIRQKKTKPRWEKLVKRFDELPTYVHNYFSLPSFLSGGVKNMYNIHLHTDISENEFVEVKVESIGVTKCSICPDKLQGLVGNCPWLAGEWCGNKIIGEESCKGMYSSLGKFNIVRFRVSKPAKRLMKNENHVINQTI